MSVWPARASSFLAAEIATSIGLHGVGEQMFASAAGGYLGSVLNQVRQQGFNVLTANIDWNVALHASEVNIATTIGSLLAHQFHPAESQFGAVGGQLAGAIGSALAYSFSVGLTAALNVFLPGVGAFFGTIIGTIIGDVIAGDPTYPKAFHDIEIIGSDPTHFQNRLFGADDGGNTAISKEMGDQVTKIANTYLDAVHGLAIDHSGKVMTGYNAGAAPYQYITGWFPNGTEVAPHFASATDAIQEGVRELLMQTEVIGGDLLVKRAHQAFVNGPHAAPNEIVSDFTDLASLGGDLRTAQDYEQYLNDRETINALIELYPDSAFTAGWAATFARVKELGLGQVNGSDFLGGLVGYLDSVNKAGLGAVAANASVKQSGTGVTVEIKVPNGTDVPGALSVFADQVSQSSDASGTTLQFVFANNLAAGFHGPGSTSVVSGVWQASGDVGNNLWFGRDDVRNEYHDYNGAQSHDILVGGAFSDTIYAGNGFDFVDGGAGGDYLFGEAGNDILRGGKDTDLLYGGAGDDTYVFNRGDGADTVFDNYHTMVRDDTGGAPSSGGTYHDEQLDGGSDTLMFGTGIRVADVTTMASSNNLVVTVHDPANPNALDTITLQNWAIQYNRIELFKFADGTTLNLTGGQASFRVPFGATLSRSSVAENSANGTVVGTVTGFDFDPAAVLSYSLSDYAGGRFAINASTGVITVAIGSALDYETTKSHQITVRTADQSGNAFYNKFTIAVTDVSETSIVESSGSTSLTVVDTIYHLGGGGSAPSLKYLGATVTFGTTGAFAPIAAERTATGYAVAWKATGADQYLMWSTDAAGNYIATTTGVLSGSSLALESLEPTFQQDLNSDGVIGIPFIEGFGATGLAVADHLYYLLTSGSGPTLKDGGATVTAGQSGAFAPISAEQIAGGYEVAWKNPNADQYIVWTTDANGNHLSNLTGVVSGSSLALESLEPGFHQDLNNDGIVGIPFIEGFGSTGLAVADHLYYLLTGGSGPTLKDGGAAVGVGQSGVFAPISAEQIAGGYEIAWKNPNADQYIVWTTDANGNHLSNLTSVVSGSSLALESLETSFHQDLNSDGITGIPFIEGFGSTGLALADHLYYLLTGGGGPTLKYLGAAVTFGQFGAFVPISAEPTATGYEVAFKNSGTGQFSIWNTDSSGNFISYTVMADSSLALESLEPTFQQDLNGDGITGIPFIEGFGSTGLALADHLYYLLTGGSGPTLKYLGAAVTFGQFGAFVPISAEPTATGYEVAFKNSGTGQFSIWNTDSSGNFISYTVMADSSLALESLEPTFQQDLNGDGITGIPFIEGFGATGLAVADHIYYLLSGGSGPTLKYLGAAVTFGQSGTFAPIAAEHTATGYDVAWKAPGADQYIVWSTDAAGNYLTTIAGVTYGSSLELKILEPTFQQDLNGDGVIGTASAVIEGFGTTSLTVADHIYYLTSGGSGPSLKYFGAAVGFGETGSTVPIAAEQTATGYDVAWKTIGADQYTVWSTDAAGNYVSNIAAGVAGNSSDLKSLEGVFHQDLNGDGVIGGSPVILDLDGNGVDIMPLNRSRASFDMDGEAGREHTAWAGGNDGILAIDLGAGGKAGPDGMIDQAAEIVFTQWSPGATSDMAALRSLFDGNRNGLLDPGDARWSEFRIWQDANGDGVSQAGEVKTLDALGIASIGLEPAGPATFFADGSAIQGLASFTRTDGSTGAAGDVSLAYQHGAVDTPGMMGPAFGDTIWRHVDATALNEWHIV